MPRERRLFCRLLGVGGGRDWRHVATGDAFFSGDCGDCGVAMPRERRLFCRLLGVAGGRDWRHVATGDAFFSGDSGDCGVAMPRERRLFCRLLGVAVDVTGVASLQETRSFLVIAVIPV